MGLLGLMPGYTTMMVYAPCLDVFFSYSANKTLLKKIHFYMTLKILSIINKYVDKNKTIKTDVKLLSYCKKYTSAKEFHFPQID